MSEPTQGQSPDEPDTDVDDSAAEQSGDAPTPGRRTFAPVVLLGLASAGLAAVAAGKPWIHAKAGSVDTSDASTVALGSIRGAESPLTAALALVVLACWGVVLVTRGGVRRAIAWLGALAAIATFVVAVLGPRTLTDPLVEKVRDLSGQSDVAHQTTAWFVVAVLSAAVSVVMTCLGARFVGSWPAMGSKYDRPGSGSAATGEPRTNLELWKALDEGEDPTA